MVDLDDVRYPGGIGARDYFFLTALVSILAPRRVIEIGTLTGFSAAIIAAAIHRQHGNSGEISVETIDARTHCIIDETRPIGFEIPELIPDLASTVRVHTGANRISPANWEHATNLVLPSLMPITVIPGRCSMCSGSRLMSKAGDGSCCMTFNWARIGKKLREAGQPLEGETPYGAEWLFDRWPFRKIRSAHIGAVGLPSRKAALIPFALTLMEEPFEVAGKAAKRARRALYQSFAELI